MSTVPHSLLSLEKAISLLLLARGFDSATTEAFDTLVNLSNFYVDSLLTMSKSHAEHTNRSGITVKDVMQSLFALGGSDGEEMLEYLSHARCMDPVNFDLQESTEPSSSISFKDVGTTSALMDHMDKSKENQLTKTERRDRELKRLGLGGKGMEMLPEIPERYTWGGTSVYSTPSYISTAQRVDRSFPLLEARLSTAHTVASSLEKLQTNISKSTMNKIDGKNSHPLNSDERSTTDGIGETENFEVEAPIVDWEREWYGIGKKKEEEGEEGGGGGGNVREKRRKRKWKF